jgi:putative hydrolase of HD superfamily
MKKEIDADVVKSTINLGKLIFQFARVNRITYFEDGETLESDTDHTVMLSVIACAFASTYKKELDLGLVAQFAIVHDLVEAYAGDTPNIHGQMKEGLKEDKIKREHEALLRIQKEFDEVYPWISKMIIEYESLATPEARFVKVLDKAMPKISHILNGVKRLK